MCVIYDTDYAIGGEVDGVSVINSLCCLAFEREGERGRGGERERDLSVRTQLNINSDSCTDELGHVSSLTSDL